jgi:large subunit ribosomal protein L25
MAEITSLPATRRARAGKGGSRALKREGRIPGIVYGGSEAPIEVAVPLKDIARERDKPAFFTHLYDLALPEGALRVLPREVQVDPVTDRPIHVDFLRYEKGARIKVQVAVHFLDQDKCEGMKLGGVLNIVRHTVELYCPVDAIPDSLSVSLAARKVGDSIHISAFTLPEGVTPVIRDRDFTVATIAAPTTMVEEKPAAAAETAEGAVAGAPAAPAEGAKAEPAKAGAAKAAEPAKGAAAAKPAAPKAEKK